MAVSITSSEKWGTLVCPVYSDSEIITAWGNIKGQGNKEARSRTSLCVIAPCTKIEQAVALTRVFLSKFNIPSCCHWNGEDLSMYCGGSGGNCQEVMKYLSKLRVD